jgi:hypothetical protein
VVEGSLLKGSDFPFKERPGKFPVACVHVVFDADLVAVDPSLLEGKTLPTLPRTCKVDRTETLLQEQHGTEQEEQEWQEIDIMDIARNKGMKAAEETAEKPRS